jgi:sec-independent protein translocase protein TatA
MNPIFAMLNGWEVVAILAIVLVLFGAKKLPELAKGLGQGIKEFKKSSREIQDELNQAMDVDAPPPPRREQIAPQSTEVHVATPTAPDQQQSKA